MYNGLPLLDQFSSFQELLEVIYPNYPWDKYQFKSVPKGFKKSLTDNIENQKEFVNYLVKKFNIKETSDWYNITSNRVMEVISMKVSDVMEIVKKFYPDLNMKLFHFSNPLGSKKSQYTLKSMLLSLFPNQEIIEEYRHADLENLEIDYYLPHLKLGFEYQVILFLFLYSLYNFLFILFIFVLFLYFYYFIIIYYFLSYFYYLNSCYILFI